MQKKLQQHNTVSQKICIGECWISGGAIKELEVTDALHGSHRTKTATAVVFPPPESRWDYCAESKVTVNEVLELAGVCPASHLREDGAVTLELHDHSWDFDHAVITNIEFFGMDMKEVMYWLPTLTNLVSGVSVPGLVLETQLRPFLYAVPLNSLTAQGIPRSFALNNDLGVTAGGEDNMFAPLVAKLKKMPKQAAWHPDVPKAFGVVLATDPMQAERRALDRAQFTADLINFALRAGLSHLEDRWGSQLLPWKAEQGRMVVSLHPWILVRESASEKGWVRAVPLVDASTRTDLADGHQRITAFAEHFVKASAVGDVKDQNGARQLTERERRLATGIQRSLRWLGIASRETGTSDQFVASWVALEAILDSMEYPGMFTGKREAVRESLKQRIREILPIAENKLSVATGPSAAYESLLTIDAQMLEGRLAQNQWPLRRKLDMFAKAFKITLLPGDGERVAKLGGLRGKILHTGRDDSPVSKEQLRGLQYLVERLLAAASFGAYRDLEDGIRHEVRLGQVGPNGGAAPMTLDGKQVSYRSRLLNGGADWEFVVEGKVYDTGNSELGFAK